MSSDKLDFLDSEQPEEKEAKAKADVEETPDPVEAEAEPEAAEDAVEASEESKGETEAAPPAAEPETKAIPVTALLDEREKRQAAQRKAEEAERRNRELEARLTELEKPTEQPDFYTDPDAALKAREQQFEKRLMADKLRTSRFLAEREFGKEVVEEAYAYFDQHPQESQAMLQHPSPFHAAVEHFKRQKFLAEVQDPEAWREAQLEAMRKQVAEEAATATPPKPKMPPASLSTATAAGGEPKTPGTAFDQTFG